MKNGIAARSALDSIERHERRAIAAQDRIVNLNKIVESIRARTTPATLSSEMLTAIADAEAGDAQRAHESFESDYADGLRDAAKSIAEAIRERKDGAA